MCIILWSRDAVAAILDQRAPVPENHSPRLCPAAWGGWHTQGHAGTKAQGQVSKVPPPRAPGGPNSGTNVGKSHPSLSAAQSPGGCVSRDPAGAAVWHPHIQGLMG